MEPTEAVVDVLGRMAELVDDLPEPDEPHECLVVRERLPMIRLALDGYEERLARKVNATPQPTRPYHEPKKDPKPKDPEPEDAPPEDPPPTKEKGLIRSTRCTRRHR